MFFHWMIKLLNYIFVLFLGIVTLRLLYLSIASEWVRRSSPSKRAELFLRVMREGTPILKLGLEKSHYLIGRGSECDIPLKGMGIPLEVGEIYPQNGHYVFKNILDNSVMINNEPIGQEVKEIFPGDSIKLYDYTITLQNT